MTGVVCTVSLAVVGLESPLPYVAMSSPAIQNTRAQRDGQRDFDFEIGTWTTHLSRRVRPLTGSTTWVTYEGTSVVRKIWDGRANLVHGRQSQPRHHHTPDVGRRQPVHAPLPR